MKCHVCGLDSKKSPLYPDPCCSAPDCNCLTDVVHRECASDFVRREIDADNDYAYENAAETVYYYDNP